MIFIENEMKTHLFLKTFNVVNEINISLAYAAFTLLYRITEPLYSKLILNCLFIVFMAIIDFMKASINFTDYLDFTYFINCIDFVDLIDYIGLTN